MWNIKLHKLKMLGCQRLLQPCRHAGGLGLSRVSATCHNRTVIRWCTICSSAPSETLNSMLPNAPGHSRSAITFTVAIAREGIPQCVQKPRRWHQRSIGQRHHAASDALWSWRVQLAAAQTHPGEGMDGKLPTVLSLCRSAEDRGTLLQDTIGPGLQLMHQVVRVGQLSLTLVVPADVDAVMDMYIERGEDLDLTAQHGSLMAAAYHGCDHRHVSGKGHSARSEGRLPERIERASLQWSPAQQSGTWMSNEARVVHLCTMKLQKAQPEAHQSSDGHQWIDSGLLQKDTADKWDCTSDWLTGGSGSVSRHTGVLHEGCCRQLLRCYAMHSSQSC